MIPCIQKSVDSMRTALEVSIQADFDGKLREMQEETKKAPMPLEQLQRSLLSNRAVSLGNPQLLVNLTSEFQIQT